MTRSSLPLWTRCSKFCLVAALFLVLTAAQQCHGAYYGKLIGRLSELHHKVSGEVYAVDGRTLYIKDFTYDGEGPAAFFYAGNSKNPNGNGFRVRDEHGTTNVLKRYRKKDITLTLPEGKTLNNIKWFSVWCDEFSVNFGDVKIPRGFDYPRPQKLAALNGVHGVSSEPVVVVDAQTLLIPGFSYDGEAPDAKFWVGPGPSPTPQGIRVPDENGKVVPLRRYDRKTIVLTLPDDLTIHQLGHFGVWCEAFTVDFGHVKIPQGLNVPPSLKMLGVSPQNVRGGQGQSAYTQYQQTSPTSSSSASSSSHPSASLLDQQHYRPTTYRPLLRRDDQVQVVQALDYRIPKSLQLQEPIQQLHQVQQPYQLQPQQLPFQYLAENPNLTQLRQLANVQTIQPIVQRTYHNLAQQHPSSLNPSQLPGGLRYDGQATRFLGNPYYTQEAVSRLGQPQQASHSRLLRYQGDQRLDSYVRY
ncbi:protein Skeletor, isoforms B/C isoform X3 [Cephus cinctus]|uniref:Protein Skeletor, isoforms B/C isoform X3 n=1 Tax=Cephus cinctus TaxID=211228 RepID=A0AAJ7W128_CEPCN|nr:protein Skeletor, isoforms B/C isoform X3 [Cephus cinctus]